MWNNFKDEKEISLKEKEKLVKKAIIKSIANLARELYNDVKNEYGENKVNSFDGYCVSFYTTSKDDNINDSILTPNSYNYFFSNIDKIIESDVDSTINRVPEKDEITGEYKVLPIANEIIFAKKCKNFNEKELIGGIAYIVIPIKLEDNNPILFSNYEDASSYFDKICKEKNLKEVYNDNYCLAYSDKDEYISRDSDTWYFMIIKYNPHTIDPIAAYNGMEYFITGNKNLIGKSKTIY